MKNGKSNFRFSYSTNITNFEVFCWGIKLRINRLFLKSVVQLKWDVAMITYYFKSNLITLSWFNNKAAVFLISILIFRLFWKNNYLAF